MRFSGRRGACAPGEVAAMIRVYATTSEAARASH